MAIYMWRERVMPDYPCFTALSSGYVQLEKSGSPTNITIETSTDGLNWSTYTFGTAISLPNVGDKVYFRNISETDTGFTIDRQNYYRFKCGSGNDISISGDISYLLNKNGTTNVSSQCFRQLFENSYFTECSIELPATTLAEYCYIGMFQNCVYLRTAPKLPATTLATYCYGSMFEGCSNLETLTELPATTLAEDCYTNMFRDCSKIKLSTTQTGEYQTPYRIPKSGTGTDASDSMLYMFLSTGGTFGGGTPSINTTYYTSNTVV